MTARKWLCVGALALLTLALYFWGLGRVPFRGTGEARESLEVQEEVGRGEWILPMRNGVDLPSKPPLYHWLGGVTALMTGAVDERSLRLPSALLATVTVFVVFWYGARKWGFAAGAYGAFILATNFLWIRTARSARVDMTLNAFLTGALVAFDVAVSAAVPSRAALALFYLCMGLAALAKGPIGILLPGMVAGTYLLLRRDLARLRQLHVLLGGATALAIAGCWYVLAIIHGGEAFFRKQILSENLNTFFGPKSDPGTPPHDFYYVVPALCAGFAPWSLFLIPLAFSLWRLRGRLDAEGYLYPLVWLLSIFIFFTVAAGKRGEYLLPVYPAAALLVGAWWGRLGLRDSRPPAPIRRAVRATAVVGAVAVLLLVGAVLVEAQGARAIEWVRPLLHRRDQANLQLVRAVIAQQPGALVAWATVLVPVVGVFVVSVWRSRWPWVFAALVACVAATTLVINGVLHPALARDDSFKPFMATVRGTLAAGDELVFYNTFDYGAVFYWGDRIPIVRDSFGDPPATGRTRYLLVWEDTWKRLPAEQQARLDVVQRSNVADSPDTGARDRLLLARARAAAAP